MTLCYFCNKTFTRKDNFTRHLKEARCEEASKMTPYDFYLKIEEEVQKAQKSTTITGNNNISVSPGGKCTVTNINVQIQIQPVTKLALEHITPEKMKEVIEQYDSDKSKLNYLLSEYLNNLFCDTQHPENHSVKYIKRYPPLFNSITEDADGKTITVIRGLKDTCELLTDPVLDVLKVKLNECIRKYKREKEDPDSDYDYSLYENAIRELQKELRKDKIKQVLANFLKNDLINNIQMKFKIDVNDGIKN
jgi:hypothetical protein